MAGSALSARIHFHTRSTSLPSRSHPLTTRVEEHLNRLRSSQGTSSSSSSVRHSLSGLKDLYDCVDDLLKLPLAQQVLAHERHEKWVNEVLDGSLKMLDACGSSRDVLLQMKQCVQELQSSIRRKRDGEFASYVACRKKVHKATSKCIGALSSSQTRRSFSCLDKDHDVVATVSMLREVEAITSTVFESLLSFFLGPKSRSKRSGWSLVSKLMHAKRVTCEREEDLSEVEKVDAALYTLMGHNTCKDIGVLQDVQKRLEVLELSILDLDEGLECAFRCLIKTRVSLLNILNH